MPKRMTCMRCQLEAKLSTLPEDLGEAAVRVAVPLPVGNASGKAYSRYVLHVGFCLQLEPPQSQRSSTRPA